MRSFAETGFCGAERTVSSWLSAGKELNSFVDNRLMESRCTKLLRFIGSPHLLW
jgi:fluoride ion exporter CrcB/FEX